MTNLQIVVIEAITNEVFTEDQCVEYLVTTGALPLYTLKRWNKKGYRVKKGEHAKIITRLWKHNEERKTTDENGQEVTILPDREYGFITARLFTPDQVEPARA